MRGNTYIRFVVLSILLAIFLAATSFLLMNRLSLQTSTAERDRFLIFLAESIEENIGSKSLSEVENPFLRPRPPPPPPMEMRRPFRNPPPPGFRGPGGPGGGRPRLWIVKENGEVVFSARDDALPMDWKSLKKPLEVHEITEKVDFFRLFPAVHVIRLSYKEPLYLVGFDPRPSGFLPLFATQALIIFLTVTLGFVASFCFLFIYMRRKSTEARAILKRLAQGDLKARFPLKKFDEVGGLLVDFNYMADQIEKLVHRIHETESVRKNLVQELGHDLRTPLTSLRTATETLLNLEDKMSREERRDLVLMIEDETRYFGQLLENLMVIASLDEPQFKSSTTVIDISEVLTQQVKRRQQSGKNEWKLSIQASHSNHLPILGDEHLIERLINNAFSNAERFANKSVEVLVSKVDTHYEIQIRDDGPGLGESQIKEFGKRRSFQKRRLDKGLHSSLGLGSVIMRSITELHDGHLAIDNILKEGAIVGARLTILLPVFDQTRA